MPEYLLFVDTETTGLPARWNRPYAEEWAWPCIAQVTWVVFTAAGELVKTDQDYLQIPAGHMPAAAIAVHGLTPQPPARQRAGRAGAAGAAGYRRGTFLLSPIPAH